MHLLPLVYIVGELRVVLVGREPFYGKYLLFYFCVEHLYKLLLVYIFYLVWR